MQYVVQPGDSPTRIAGNVWGNQRYYQLVPGNLHPGQVLDLPDDPGGDPVITQQQWAAAPAGYSGGQAQYGNPGGGAQPAAAKPTGPKVPAIGQVPVPSVGNPGQQWGIPAAPAKPTTNVKLPGAPQTGPGGAGTFANTATKPRTNYSYGGGTSVGKTAMQPSLSQAWGGASGTQQPWSSALGLSQLGSKLGGAASSLGPPGVSGANWQTYGAGPSGQKPGGFTTGQLYQGQVGQTGAGGKKDAGIGWGQQVVAMTPDGLPVRQADVAYAARYSGLAIMEYGKTGDRNQLPRILEGRVARELPVPPDFGSLEDFLLALGYAPDAAGNWMRMDPKRGGGYGGGGYSGQTQTYMPYEGGGYSRGYGYDGGGGYGQSNSGTGLTNWRIGS